MGSGPIGIILSDRRVSNSRPSAWEANALPTELLSQIGYKDKQRKKTTRSEWPFFNATDSYIWPMAQSYLNSFFSVRMVPSLYRVTTIVRPEGVSIFRPRRSKYSDDVCIDFAVMLWAEVVCEINSSFDNS